MTTYARREVVTHRIEYGLAAGAPIGDLYRVLAIAWHDFCDRTGRDPENSCTDDWAKILPHDDETVIAFEYDKRTQP